MSPSPTHKALLEALNQYESRLLQYAYAVCKNRDCSQDAVQETFLKLAKNAATLDLQNLGPWLFTVCRNCLFDLHRRNAKSASVEDLTGEISDPSPTPDLVAQQREEQLQLLDLIDRLPPKQREVVRLRYLGDLSYTEIAAATSMGTGTVGRLLHDALNSLRKTYPNPTPIP